jgi:hypothetical protein
VRSYPAFPLPCARRRDSSILNLKVRKTADGAISDATVFRGLVPTINQRLHDIAPRLRNGMQTLHVEMRETFSSVETAITEGNKVVSDALMPCGMLFTSCAPAPAPPAAPPPARPAGFWIR